MELECGRYCVLTSSMVTSGAGGVGLHTISQSFSLSVGCVAVAVAGIGNNHTHTSPKFNPIYLTRF